MLSLLTNISNIVCILVQYYTYIYYIMCIIYYTYIIHFLYYYHVIFNITPPLLFIISAVKIIFAYLQHWWIGFTQVIISHKHSPIFSLSVPCCSSRKEKNEGWRWWRKLIGRKLRSQLFVCQLFLGRRGGGRGWDLNGRISWKSRKGWVSRM